MSDSRAWLDAWFSSAFISFLNCVRHCVMATVYHVYATRVPSVTPAYIAPNLADCRNHHPTITTINNNYCSNSSSSSSNSSSNSSSSNNNNNKTTTAAAATAAAAADAP